MKKSVLTISSILLGITVSYAADGYRDRDAGRGEASIEARASTDSSAQLSHNFKASQLMGMTVKNRRNESLGEIKDLVVDLPAGRIVYAVFGAGGLLGIGDRYLAIPPKAFALGSDSKSIFLEADKDMLKAAPGFDRNNWPDMADQRWTTEVYRYHHQQPYWDAKINEPAGAEVEVKVNDKNRDLKEPAPSANAARDERHRDPSWLRGYHNTNATARGELKGAADHKGFGTVTRASDLMGRPVNNPQGEKLGEIKDMLIDMQTGRIVYAVLGAGGFLGLGDKLYAVPPGAFARSADERTFSLRADREMLKTAASFDRNHWPDTADKNFAADAYLDRNRVPAETRTERKDVTEPAGAEVKAKADDKGVEIKAHTDDPTRTRSSRVTTESERERQVSMDVQRALTSDTSLSAHARNLQILTKDGRVTLRGTVKSQAEKDAVEAKAKAVSGVVTVDNQLQVQGSR
jgi:osmotically-inducible protein OsmY